MIDLMVPYGVLWCLMVSYGASYGVLWCLVVSCGVLWCLMVSIVVSYGTLFERTLWFNLFKQAVLYINNNAKFLVHYVHTLKMKLL